MNLQVDRDANIESLPLKLIIISIIIAISVPFIWNGLLTYSKIQLENNLRIEFEKIATTAKQVYLGGNGTAIKVQISFESSLFSKLEFVRIGDRLDDAKSSTIRYKLSGESERFYLIKPNIPLTHKNGPLELQAGDHTLLLKHVLIGDVNGNNILDKDENYIEISRL